MSELEDKTGLGQNGDPTELPPGHHSLMEIFDELSFREKVHKVLEGLKQPKDSGEYKYAMYQIQRLWAPFSAVLIPCLVVLLLTIMSAMKTEIKSYQVTVVEPKEIEKLEEIKPIEEPIKPPEEEPIDIPTDEITVGAGAADGPPNPNPGDFSPQPAEFDSVAMTRSPVVMRGIYASRSPGQRGSALGRHGGSGATEACVYRALRWLKKYQDSDGKWTTTSGGGPGGPGPCSPAMTGLALLTYLAHGETPASAEFGPTVERAMRWLVDNQNADGHFQQSDGNEYSLPIAAYALCESFSLTKVPMLKDAATKSIDAIVRGQNGRGLWTYKCVNADRSDTSYGGWCVQAIKAGVMAELEVNGLKECANRAIGGLKSNYGSGGFGYTSPGTSKTLTPVGVLCLQILGAGKNAAVRDPMNGMLKDATCNWQQGWCGNPIYCWYYLTQAKFHEGGDHWKSWNREFSPTLVKNQIVIAKAIENMKGEKVDIGYWQTTATEEHCKAYVYNTTLCALMLTVYYRHLPTYKPPSDIEAEAGFADKNEDIKIQVQ